MDRSGMLRQLQARECSREGLEVPPEMASREQANQVPAVAERRQPAGGITKSEPKIRPGETLRCPPPVQSGDVDAYDQNVCHVDAAAD